MRIAMIGSYIVAETQSGNIAIVFNAHRGESSDIVLALLWVHEPTVEDKVDFETLIERYLPITSNGIKMMTEEEQAKYLGSLKGQS